MSRYIRLLNSIKTNIAVLSLTPSQLACRVRIEDRLAYPGIVNLYGQSGTGKTVLGWALSANGYGIFLGYPPLQVSDDLKRSNFVIVDNAEADHRAFRRLLGKLETAGVQRAIITTRQPVDDYVFRVELNLTDEDIATVLQNIRDLGFQFDQTEAPTLWQLVLHAVKEA